MPALLLTVSQLYYTIRNMNLVMLSQRIQALRKERKLTLQQLALRVGLTRSVLSKVENFRVTPSLPALGRISDGLGVTLSEMVQGLDEKPTLSIVRKSERTRIERDRPDSKFVYHALAHKRQSKAMEPFIVEIPSGEARRQMLGHEGEEFFIVLRGTVDFEYGDETHRLNNGDCVYADGNVKHRLINPRAGVARILIVFYRSEK